ncbi:hypothetical protein DL93DRAFT_2232460 [Clavulina sp. PMI_390]|nr:hypothetical protein DL93DRAFT_2232460 [Clavulina sp. PMI_390]
MEDDETAAPTAASLNPEVLSSIIVSMRESFAQERAQFQSTLAEANSKNAELESRRADADEQLQAANEKIAALQATVSERDHSLTVLRQTLEESRRGIMRLQTENKRASVIMGPPPSAGGPQSGGTSRASKRLSLNPNAPLVSSSVPRTPSHHRRISSVSDSAAILGGLSLLQDGGILSRNGSSPPPTSSLLPATPFLSNSPPNVDSALPSPNPPQMNFVELDSLKAELAQTKRQLADAVQARLASEDVVKGLRELIAANTTEDGVMRPSPGLSGLQLPPLPSDPDIESHDQQPSKAPERKGPMAAWGGLTSKLWRDGGAATGQPSSSSSPANNNNNNDMTAPPPAPKLDRVLSSSSSISSGSAAETSGAATSALGGFMSWRRGSSATSPSINTALNSAPTPDNTPVSSTTGDGMNVTSPSNSWGSKFAFFSKGAGAGASAAVAPPAAAADKDTASIMSASSRPTSVSTSGLSGQISPLSATHEPMDGDHVRVVQHGGEGEEDDEPAIQEISLHDEYDDVPKSIVFAGEMTPTTATSGAGFAI